MKKYLALLISIFMCISFVGCNTYINASTDTSINKANTTEKISQEVLNIIQEQISVAIYQPAYGSDYTVFATDKDNGINISINIKQIGLIYQFAWIIYEICPVIEQQLSKYTLTLTELHVSTFFYENGEQYIVSWNTSNLSTGTFIDAKGNYYNRDASVSDICNYAKFIPDEKPTEKEQTKSIEDDINTNIISKLSKSQIALVTLPTKEYIIQGLNNVKDIVSVEVPTDDNEPNNKLKDKGCILQIYFGSNLVDPERFEKYNFHNIEDETPIKNGTAGGGCIEVYNDTDSAMARNEYLQGFDDWDKDLGAGSHVCIGTIVIRTSRHLPTEKQISLTSDIITALTTE